MNKKKIDPNSIASDYNVSERPFVQTKHIIHRSTPIVYGIPDAKHWIDTANLKYYTLNSAKPRVINIIPVTFR